MRGGRLRDVHRAGAAQDGLAIGRDRRGLHHLRPGELCSRVTTHRRPAYGLGAGEGACDTPMTAPGTVWLT